MLSMKCWKACVAMQRHAQKFEQAEWCYNCCFRDILWRHWNLVVGTNKVNFGEQGKQGKILDVRDRVPVWLGCCIESATITAWMPLSILLGKHVQWGRILLALTLSKVVESTNLLLLRLMRIFWFLLLLRLMRIFWFLKKSALRIGYWTSATINVHVMGWPRPTSNSTVQLLYVQIVVPLAVASIVVVGPALCARAEAG